MHASMHMRYPVADPACLSACRPQQLTDSQAEYAKSAADDAAAAVAAAQQAIATLSQSLTAQKGELQAFADKQVADAEASLAATNQLLDSTSSAVTSMNQTASDAKWVAPWPYAASGGMPILTWPEQRSA